jgi:hypothetical protein
MTFGTMIISAPLTPDFAGKPTYNKTKLAFERTHKNYRFLKGCTINSDKLSGKL